MSHWTLRAGIVTLAWSDGVLHLALDFVLFKGRLFHSTLSELFLLNFIGFVLLGAMVLVGPRWLGGKHWLVDIVLIGYSAGTVLAWLNSGSPNPLGLGYTSKAMEVMLVVALLADLWIAAQRSPGPAGQAIAVEHERLY
jgi:hypothetical protein